MYGGVNNIRFGGMASGLDTEKIIKDLMRLEQTRVDRVVQQKQLLEWKRSDYREINTRLLSLRNAAFDLRLQGTFLSRQVASSNESALQAVSADSGTVTGNYEIEVKQLARGASYQAQPAVGFTAVAGEFTVTGKSGSVNISLNGGENAKEVAAKINAQANATGVRAVYDENLNRFFLMSTDTGNSAVIKFTAKDAGGKDSLESLLGGTFAVNSEVQLGQGQDAILSINGGNDLLFSSNTIKVLGINMVLKGEGSSTLTVSQNIDGAVDKIKAFVESYNAVMEKINTKLTEKRYRDYLPLTEEQKKEMKEKEIELWEEKAKSGLLASDSLLSGIASSLRQAAMDSVAGLEGNYKTLSSIGITTLSWNDKGKLYINEEKLRNALSEDMEGVMNLFANSNANGIANKIYDRANASINQVVNKAGRDDYKVDNSILGKEILAQDKKLSDLQEKLYKIEDRYWKQFTAMEKALARMQSQSDWLTAQLMGGK